MSRLAEAYFHLKPFEVSDSSLARIGREITSIAANAAAELFQPNDELEVSLEPGSLKGRARVLGTIGIVFGATYGGIVKYKDFREGVGLIVQDARTFGTSVIEPTLRAAHATPDQIYRVERRTKTPGRMLRFLKRREWFNQNWSELSPEAATEERRALSSLEGDILADLPPDQQRLFKKIVREEDGPGSPTYPSQPEALEDRSRWPSELHGLVIRAPDLIPYEDYPRLDNPTPPAPGNFYGRFKLGDWADFQRFSGLKGDD